MEDDILMFRNSGLMWSEIERELRLGYADLRPGIITCAIERAKLEEDEEDQV